MISEELVDLLNNTRIGRVIRIISLDINDDGVKQELGTDYDVVYSCLRGENLFKLPSNKFLNLSPEVLEKIDNMSKVDILDEKFINFFQLPIDFDLFEGEFSEQDAYDLKRILELTGVTRLFIRNMRDDINLGDMPVSSIFFVGGKCNFKNLKEIKTLKELELHDYDIKNLSDLDSLENLSSFYLSTDKEENREKLDELSKLPKHVDSCINIGDTILKRKIFIISPDELRELLENYSTPLSIIYCGDGPIKAEWFEGKKISLKLESTLALDDEFCRKIDNLEGVEISVTNDSYPSYSGAEISAINNVIREILSQIPEGADDFIKVATVYKMLSKRITYDKQGHGENFVSERVIISRSLKGSLLEGKAVCVGFAEVLHKILNELGIESTIISGELIGGGPHAWNQIKINGQWYNTDLTWDASCVRHDEPIGYFLRSDSDFELTHKAHITYECGLKRLFKERPEFLQYLFIKNGELSQPIHETAERGYDYDKIYDFFYKRETMLHTIQTSKKMISFIKDFSIKFLRKSQIVNAILDIIQEVKERSYEKE